MVTMVELNGFEEFAAYTDNIKEADPPIFFYFSGSKTSSGVSWCPDCVDAEPVIKTYLNDLNKNITFVYVDVGDMATWKNPANPFRTSDRTKLMVIPTIIKWKGVQRLEGSQLTKRDLLQMIFEEEE